MAWLVAGLAHVLIRRRPGRRRLRKLPVLRFVLVWGAIAAQLWLGWRAARAYRALPELCASATGGALPPVSIIVPARDEAHTLPWLLPSLRALVDVDAEVIVVDDGSTDGTATVAAAHGARVVAAGPLPPGWAGKPHACVAGAAATDRPWLLFTDADTVHAPGSLAAALRYAQRHHLDALSLFCAQRCDSFWERLLLPYVYRHFFAGVRPAAVADPRRREALANGQYLLISREAYHHVGSHAAVRGSIIEDVALAHRFKQAGLRYAMLRGDTLVSVRMYRGLGEIRRGFAKNSSRFLLADPGRGAVVLVSTTLDGLALPLIGAGLARRERMLLLAGAAAWLVGALGLRPWMRWFGVPGRGAALQPVAAAVFQVVALDGVRALRRGGTTWKGRRY